MAEIVKKYDFPPTRSRNKYPWTEWLDGRIWALKQGEDFEVNPATFVSSAKSYVERHTDTYDTVNVNVEDNTVVLQAILRSE